MDIKFLREFLALSQCLNYSAAAKQLFISQSMLSKHVMSMEDELGAKLLIRDGRSVRLTAAGKLFADRCHKILECYDNTRQEISDLEKAVESVLKIGYLYATTHDYFPEACADFHKNHPNVRVSVAALEVDEITEGVRNGTLDLGYTISPSGLIKDLESSLFSKDCYGICCRKNHPLARKKNLTLANLKGYKILMPDPKDMPSVSRATRQVFDGCGYKPDFCEDMHDIGSIKPFLLTSGGVALAPSHIVNHLDKNYVFIPLEDVEIHPHTIACWKASHESEMLLDFIDSMHKAYKAREDKMEQDN